MVNFRYFNKEYINARRAISLMAAIVFGLNMSSALGESNTFRFRADKRAGTSAKGDEAKDSQYEFAGDTVTIHQADNVDQNDERNMLNSFEEFTTFRDAVLEEGWDMAISEYATSSAKDREKLVNALVLSLSLASCGDIQKELKKTGEFVVLDTPFIFSNYNASLGLFYTCFEKSLTNPKLNLCDFVHDENDRKKFAEVYMPLYECGIHYIKKRNFDAEQVKKVSNTIASKYDEALASGDLQLLIYVAMTSSACYSFMINIDGKKNKEAVSACIDVADKISAACYSEIYNNTDIIIKVKVNR